MAKDVFISEYQDEALVPGGTVAPLDIPVADLVLRLGNPSMSVESDGRHATAVATLIFRQARKEPIVSRRYRFTAPLPAVNTEDAAWYFERYPHWPAGVFQERARRVEACLPNWGQALFEALVGEGAARGPLEAWRMTRQEEGVARQFTVRLEAESTGEAREGAGILLSLPWELLHDGRAYLMREGKGARVRRRPAARETTAPLCGAGPLRVLLVCPRPEDQTAAADRRGGISPLLEAMAEPGGVIDVDVLVPATLPALEATLREANRTGGTYHAIHFDGFAQDRREEAAALLFEEAGDGGGERRGEVVHPGALAELLAECGVSLCFLDARHGVRSQWESASRVAGALYQSGVPAVIAMRRRASVETVCGFARAFYRELGAGHTVAAALQAGQKALQGDSGAAAAGRGLQDWFLPLLFQGEQDFPLVQISPELIRQRRERRHAPVWGDLPAPPPHGFIGRSRELFQGWRSLNQASYLVVSGAGGEGKTALACELARELVIQGRCARAVFVKPEPQGEVRDLLGSIGRQVVNGFPAETGQVPEHALALIQAALREQPAVLVLDGMEALLPFDTGVPGTKVQEPGAMEKFLDICQEFASGGARLIFTSRKGLPSPFAEHHLLLGPLERGASAALLSRVMVTDKLEPLSGDSGESEAEIDDLAEACRHHARTLAQAAAEAAVSGVRGTARALRALAAKLDEHCLEGGRACAAWVALGLALRRVSPETRTRLRALAVFEGGGSMNAIGRVLGLEPEGGEIAALIQQLAEAGLGERAGQHYPGGVRFDPDLTHVLLAEMSSQERAEARQQWSRVMTQLTLSLYEQWYQDAQLAGQFTLLELPNLLANLQYLNNHADAEAVVQLASRIEQLLANANRPRALSQVIRIRDHARRRVGGWSHAQYLAEDAAVDRLMQSGRFTEAVAAANALLDKARAAGNGTYDGAAYDCAMVYCRLGRALKNSGDPDAALEPLAAALERFQKLAKAGGRGAERMAAVALTERGNCLLLLGRLDAAGEAYETAIDLCRKRGDRRAVAVGKSQFGTVRMLQQRYADALAAYEEARDIFAALGETRSVAALWHQIGMVHRRARQYAAAEKAYQESVKLGAQGVSQPDDRGASGE